MLLCLKGVFYFKAVRAIVNKFEPIRHKYTMFVWVWPILMIIYSVDLTIFKGPGGLRNDNAFACVQVQVLARTKWIVYWYCRILKKLPKYYVLYIFLNLL